MILKIDPCDKMFGGRMIDEFKVTVIIHEFRWTCSSNDYFVLGNVVEVGHDVVWQQVVEQILVQIFHRTDLQSLLSHLDKKFDHSELSNNFST